MHYLCGKFGGCNLSRFWFYRADRYTQTHRQTRVNALLPRIYCRRRHEAVNVASISDRRRVMATRNDRWFQFAVAFLALSGTRQDWRCSLFSISLRLSVIGLKVGFNYPSSRPEFTGRVDGPRTRVHFLTPVNSGRQLG